MTTADAAVILGVLLIEKLPALADKIAADRKDKRKAAPK